MSFQSRLADLTAAIRDKINLMVPRLLPSGGTSGQVLIKNTDTDFDTEWASTGAWTPVTATGTGAQQLITLPEACTTQDVIVFVKGIFQHSGYNVTDNLLVTTQPAGFEIVVVRYGAGVRGQSGLDGTATVDTVLGLTLALSQKADINHTHTISDVTGLQEELNEIADSIPTQIAASSTGISVKSPVRVVAQTNITLSGLQTIDNVALAIGDRVLLVGQTDATQNGVYIVASGSWTRASTEASSSNIKGAFWQVLEGNNARSEWLVNNSTTPVIGTDAINIVLFGENATYTASNGTQIVGSDIRAQTKSNGGIVADSTGIFIDTTIVARKYSTTIGDGSSTQISVVHNLGSEDVNVSIREAGTNDAAAVGYTIIDNNSLFFNFAVAPPLNAFRVTVTG